MSDVQLFDMFRHAAECFLESDDPRALRAAVDALHEFLRIRAPDGAWRVIWPEIEKALAIADFAQAQAHAVVALAQLLHEHPIDLDDFAGFRRALKARALLRAAGRRSASGTFL